MCGAARTRCRCRRHVYFCCACEGWPHVFACILFIGVIIHFCSCVRTLLLWLLHVLLIGMFVINACLGGRRVYWAVRA
jgi:hypothetical protein